MKTVPSKVPSGNGRLPDGSENYTKPLRFPRLSQLKSLWHRTKDLRGTMLSWKATMAQYERLPYKGPDGQLFPNFGILRGEVDKKLTQYTDYATERKRWFNIETDFEEESSQTSQWSEQISFAFQKYCIKRWKKKFSEILLACKDMLLFSKGALPWLDEDSCYPEHVCIENVWPDGNAKMFPDSFDVLFIKRNYTAEELYNKIKEGESMGWRKSAVLSVLRSSLNEWAKCSDRTIFLKFRNHHASQDELDFEISCVFAYVTEYPKSGPRVSRFVFPECGCIPEDVANDRYNAKPSADEMDDEVGYMCYQPKWKESMTQAITIIAHTVCTNFYEDPSFAELIYTSAKTNDIVVNRILQAVEDNMRVYLQSGTTDQMKKMSRMRHGNFQVMEPGMKLVQDRIMRPVQDAMNVVQMVSSQQRQNQGDEQAATGDSKQKTAHEASLDFSKGMEVSSSSLKILNQYLENLGTEMFRRFTHPTKKSGAEYEQFQKFKAYLTARHVPDAAWDTENVTIESVVDLGAGSPAARLQSAQVVAQALSVPAASPGERQAQRDMIAAAKGIENVRLYLPDDDDQANFPELRIIGIENDQLTEAGANPQNVQVRAQDMHMLHIQGHMADAKVTLQKAGQYFHSLSQLNPEDIGIHLKTIQDLLIGIDNEMAHTMAHIQMAARVKKSGLPLAKAKLVQLKQFGQQMQQINKAKDDLEKQLSQMQQARMKEAQQKTGQDPKVAHQQRMWQLEEEHAKTMNQLDLDRNETKGEQLRNNSAKNAEHKRNLETLKVADEVSKDDVVHAVKVGQKVREHEANLAMKKKEANTPSKK